MAATLSYNVARPWQNAATMRAARTQEMFLKIFRNINLRPPQMLCAGQNESTFRKHDRVMFVPATLCPRFAGLEDSEPLISVKHSQVSRL